jgi:hypothetical protein
MSEGKFEQPYVLSPRPRMTFLTPAERDELISISKIRLVQRRKELLQPYINKLVKQVLKEADHDRILQDLKRVCSNWDSPSEQKSVLWQFRHDLMLSDNSFDGVFAQDVLEKTDFLTRLISDFDPTYFTWELTIYTPPGETGYVTVVWVMFHPDGCVPKPHPTESEMAKILQEAHDRGHVEGLADPRCWRSLCLQEQKVYHEPLDELHFDKGTIHMM